MTPLNEKDFLESLRQEFLDTSGFTLDECEKLLLKAEKISDPTLFDEFRRQLHSLKGSAQAIQLGDIGKALHDIEAGFANLSTAGDLKKSVQYGLNAIDQLRALLS